MALITYEMAVKHLKQDGVLDASPSDEDLQRKIEQASAMVQTALKRFGEWDEETDAATDPEFAWAQAMTLKVLGHLYRFRGDDTDEPSMEEMLKKSGITLYRDPSLA